ncbi:MAG: TlpA disulfide reductase family protein [Alphaproteobacteria bacterium]
MVKTSAKSGLSFKHSLWIGAGLVALVLVLYAGSLWLLNAKGTPPEFEGEYKALAWRDAPMGGFEYYFNLRDDSESNQGWSQVKLSDFRGKVIVLNFWASWCQPCIKELPSFDRLQALYDPDEMMVIPVSIDLASEQQAAIAMWDRLGLDHMPMARETLSTQKSHRAISTFFLETFPTTYILDRTGKIQATLLGDADWSSSKAQAVIDWMLEQ